jgi:hypothetical protein
MDFKTMKTSQEKHRWNKFFQRSHSKKMKVNGPKRHISVPGKTVVTLVFLWRQKKAFTVQYPVIRTKQRTKGGNIVQ